MCGTAKVCHCKFKVLTRNEFGESIIIHSLIPSEQYGTFTHSPVVVELPAGVVEAEEVTT
jgi:hypothetical protein